MEYVRCISQCFSCEFNASVFYHLCTYFFFCRILLSMYRSKFSLTIMCGVCSLHLAFVHASCNFLLNSMLWLFTICARIINLSLFFLLPIYHISPCKSQYHSYFHLPFHGARVVHATFVSPFPSINDCMII